MKVQRMTTGAAGPAARVTGPATGPGAAVRPTDLRRGEFEATVSDQGVTIRAAGPAAGASGAARPTGLRRGELEAAVADRGATIERQGKAAPVGERQGTVQVTSNPSLQKVLSAAEIQALIRQFASGQATEPAAERSRVSGYNGRGASLEAPQEKLQGHLVDVIG